VSEKAFDHEKIRKYRTDVSALMLACGYGSVLLVECLLSHGANVNLQDSRVRILSCGVMLVRMSICCCCRVGRL
jgi:ectoine hydroxylase-related dioxygenase (phytanoyl-CoA dioxygenase family)